MGHDYAECEQGGGMSGLGDRGNEYDAIRCVGMVRRYEMEEECGNGRGT